MNIEILHLIDSKLKLTWKKKGECGSILEDELSTILERNKEIIKKHQCYGKIPFEICRTCLGSPTRHGALIKNIRNTMLSFLS